MMPAPRDEFYVGYLPAPPGIVLFLRYLLPPVLILTAGFAGILAALHGNPGSGVWDTTTPQTIAGVLSAAPYPMLRVPDAEAAAGFRTYFVVEQGKFAGGQRAARFDGQPVHARGWLLEREGRRMIELDAGPGDLAPGGGVASADLRSPAIEPLGTTVLCGEIVDTKCYLGAMKPGEGKTHKECATLCIAGGIPPTLVTETPAGARSYVLLTSVTGGPLDARILPFVADPVEIAGELVRCGDVLMLRIDPASIRRF
ncbi:MAG: hypothetical protein AB7Q17_17650 [Phycisphaerae bacterium]